MRIALFLCILFISLKIYPQHSRQDSLRSEIRISKNDTVIEYLYYRLADCFIKTQPDSALFYANIGLSQKSDKQSRAYLQLIRIKAVAFYYINQIDSSLTTYKKLYTSAGDYENNYYSRIAASSIGICYGDKGDFKSALKYQLIADSLVDSRNLKLKAKVKTDLASAYNNVNEYYNSLNSIIIALSIYEEINDSFNLIYAYNTIANTYYKLNKSTLSRFYFLRALRLNKVLKIKDIDRKILSNYALLLMNKDETIDSAIIYFDKALKLCSNNETSNDKITILVNMGIAYQIINNYSQAISKYKLALKEELINKRPNILEVVYINLGKLFIKSNELDSAYYYSKRGVAISHIVGDIEYRINGLKSLIHIDSTRNDYESLSRDLVELYKNKEVLNNTESKKNIEKLLADIEIKNAEKKNELLENQNKTQKRLIRKTRFNNLILLILIILLLAYIIGILAFRKRKRKYTDELYLNYKTITKQKEELEEIIRQKDLFFSILAHDLKNPIGSSEKLLSEYAKSNNELSKLEYNQLISLLYDTAKNTNLFLGRLLEWGDSHSKTLTINIKENNINEILSNVIETHKIQYTNKKINLILHESPIDILETDKNILALILRNILNNAIKFTPNGGTIIIKSILKHSTLKLCIIDNGQGISKEKIDSIFNSHSRSSSLGTNQEVGYGLGLKIVKEFSKKINIKIGVNSVVGEGSEFWIELPVSQ